MEYRPLGRCGTKVSAISLGAWLTYGGTVEDQNATNCIHAALDLGVNFIDTADIYARGKAEEVVGRALEGWDRSSVVLSSKVFWPMSDDVNDRGLSRKHIMESVHKTLRRLKTDYLDIYFCHRFDPDTPLEETVRAMDDLVTQGKVLYWGTSVWDETQLGAASALCRDHGWYRPQVEQPRYSLMDAHIEEKILPTCEEEGMGLVVWSPLAQGFLTGKYNDGVPQDSRAAKSTWLDRTLTPENIAKSQAFSALAQELGLSSGQLALLWVLRNPAISSAITGASKISHVEQNVAALEHADLLTDEVLAKLRQIFTGEELSW